MREAFDSGSVDALKKYVNALPLEEARKHMKAMVDAGLWVPTPGEDPGEALR
jgi:cell division cycle protein 37